MAAGAVMSGSLLDLGELGDRGLLDRAPGRRPCGGIGWASTIVLLRAGPGGAAQPGRPCCSASATEGAWPARIASLAVWRDTVHLAQPGHQGVLVDLVGVEAAQLVGEALGVARGGAGPGCASGWPGWDSVAVLPSRGRTRSTVPLARSSRTEMMPLRLRARAIGDRAAQPHGQPAGEQVTRGRVGRRDDGGAGDRLVGRLVEGGGEQAAPRA